MKWLKVSQTVENQSFLSKRNCRWCQEEFNPQTENEQFCCEQCANSYMDNEDE